MVFFKNHFKCVLLHVPILKYLSLLPPPPLSDQYKNNCDQILFFSFFLRNSCILGKKAHCEDFSPGGTGVPKDPKSFSPLCACSNLSGRGHRARQHFQCFLSDPSRNIPGPRAASVPSLFNIWAQQSSTVIEELLVDSWQSRTSNWTWV